MRETGALQALGHQVHLLHGAPTIPEGLMDGDFFAPELLDLTPLVEHGRSGRPLAGLPRT